MRKKIKVWHLELLSRDYDPEAYPSARSYQLLQSVTPQPELNRFLYATVGAPWIWYMRLSWSHQQWLYYLQSPNVQTWVAYQGANPVGYFELVLQGHGSTEVEIGRAHV